MPDRPSRSRRDAGGSAAAAGLAALACAAVLAVLLPGAAAADEHTEWRVDGPVRFEVAEGGRLEVDRDRRYLDTLELRPGGGGGTLLINELGMDDYVAGIAEMPASWPMEALKAQAVAARTYGWYVLRTSRYPGYDICPTVACQVFRGAEVVLGSEHGDRWREAVDATAGEVLVDPDGAPVLARYYSTSGGRTYANEEVFPSTGAHDHLVSIEDPYDAVSPLHRWTVRFTREEFDTLAARGQRLSTVVPVTDAERVGEVDDPRATIRVTGADGTSVEIRAGEFRDFVSRVAPDSFPDRFPPLREDGLRPLPSTVPTARYDVEVTEDEVILHGQGWGHGVGMGQYGAKGRAEDGASYLDILAAYYNGLTPTVADDLPDRIRVGISAPAELTVGADASVQVTAGDEMIEEAALGAWTVARDGESWRLVAPDGHGQPLAVSATTVTEGLAQLTDAVTVEAEVNKPVHLALAVTDPGGATVLTRDLGVVEAGRHTVVWRLNDAEGSLVDPGRYRIGLIGEDHAGDEDGTPVEVTVPEREEPSATEDAESADRSASGSAGRDVVRVVAVAVGLLALAAAGLLVIRRLR